MKEKNSGWLRAQVSTELLITLGFVITITIPIILLVYMETTHYARELYISQAAESCEKLKNAVDIVGSMGEGSKMQYTMYTPRGVAAIEMDGFFGASEREITYVYLVRGIPSHIVRTTLFKVNKAGINLERLAREGTHSITLEMKDGKVVITS